MSSIWSNIKQEPERGRGEERDLILKESGAVDRCHITVERSGHQTPQPQPSLTVTPGSAAILYFSLGPIFMPLSRCCIETDGFRSARATEIWRFSVHNAEILLQKKQHIWRKIRDICLDFVFSQHRIEEWKETYKYHVDVLLDACSGRRWCEHVRLQFKTQIKRYECSNAAWDNAHQGIIGKCSVGMREMCFKEGVSSRSGSYHRKFTGHAIRLPYFGFRVTQCIWKDLKSIGSVQAFVPASSRRSTRA